MDYSLPGSCVHRILQASILEWGAISFSRGSSQPRDWTQVSCLAGRFFTLSHLCSVGYIVTTVTNHYSYSGIASPKVGSKRRMGRSHQKRDPEVIRGAKRWTQLPKEWVLEPVTWQFLLIPSRPDPSNYSPIYTKQELDIWSRASVEI